MAGANPWYSRTPPVPASAADVSAPASNTAAVVTYGAAGANRAHAINGVAWSYSGSGTLTGGNLLIQDGSATVFSMDVTAAGAGFVDFPVPLSGSGNLAMTITLAAGSANVTGKVNALNHRIVPAASNAPGYAPEANFGYPGNSMMVAALTA